MKPKPLFRLAFNLLAVVLLVFFLENKRKSNIRFSPNSQKVETKDLQVSNNDFIFFEAISKYLFISFTD